MKSGILNAYKPKGPTSHDVVDEVRRKTGVKRVGHAGTLDPFARGVLVVGVGRRATRILDLLKISSKVYWVKMRLGVVTETFDITGEVVEERECDVSERDVLEAVESFVGEYDQIPPAYSARKYKGKKLYELAREGRIIRLPPKRVKIYRIWDVELELPELSFRVEVSPGTYVRSLCMDIGMKLGCGGVALELLRESSGNFHVSTSLNPFEASSEEIFSSLMSVEEALGDFPGIVLNEKGKRNVLNGVRPRLSDVSDLRGSFKKGDWVKLVDVSGRILAIAKAERNSSFFETLKKLERDERVAKLERVLGE